MRIMVVMVYGDMNGLGGSKVWGFSSVVRISLRMNMDVEQVTFKEAVPVVVEFVDLPC